MRNDEVRRTTKLLCLSAIKHARRFSLFGYIAWASDETDAKISTEELDETTRMPSHYVNEDYSAGPKIQ